MTPFSFVEANSLKEAVELLASDDPTVRPFAGGTALMQMMKTGVFRPTRLVGLMEVEPKYSEIEVLQDGSVRIGALTSLTAVEHCAKIREHLPVISNTMRALSNARVRNVATVGGNLAHGDPHMDLPPVLMALGAKVKIVSRSGERELPISELITGYYETQLANNELISDVIIPAQANKRNIYLKCTTRAAHDWPTLGVAVSLVGSSDKIDSAAIVISAATERAALNVGCSEFLAGRRADAGAFSEAARIAASSVELTSDQRGSAAYKRQLVRVYVERALQQAMRESAVQ